MDIYVFFFNELCIGVFVDFDVCERVMILVIASTETFKQVFCFAIL